MTADATSSGAGSLEHATVVEIDHRGVLIRGPSGSGKTALAIELLSRCRACDIASALIADDYAFVARNETTGDLVASVPERIRGLIEFRGLGIVNVGHARWKPDTRLVLSVFLSPPDEADRVADPDRGAIFDGVALPELALLERSPVSCAYAILGWLGLSDRAL